MSIVVHAPHMSPEHGRWTATTSSASVGTANCPLQGSGQNGLLPGSAEFQLYGAGSNSVAYRHHTADRTRACRGEAHAEGALAQCRKATATGSGTVGQSRELAARDDAGDGQRAVLVIEHGHGLS